jgi:hypothetical protein
MDIDPSDRQVFLKARRLWRKYLDEDRENYTILGASIHELITSIDATVPTIYQNCRSEIDNLISEFRDPVELSIVPCNPIEGVALNHEGTGPRRNTISQGFNPIYQDGAWRQSFSIQVIDSGKHYDPKPKK